MMSGVHQRAKWPHMESHCTGYDQRWKETEVTQKWWWTSPGRRELLCACLEDSGILRVKLTLFIVTAPIGLEQSGKGQGSTHPKGSLRPHRLSGGWSKGSFQRALKDHNQPSPCHHCGKKICVYLGNGPFLYSHLNSTHLTPSINS